MELKSYTIARSALRALKGRIEKYDGELDIKEASAQPKDDRFYGELVLNSSLEGIDTAHFDGFVVRSALDKPAPTKHNNYYINEFSVIGGACGAVWDIADTMVGARRKDVIEACRRSGIAFGTARTQYQKWSMHKRTGVGKRPSGSAEEV